MAKTSGTFGYYVLATSVPSYFNSIFNVKITENGLYTALMYLAIGITLLSAGPVSTFIITKKWLPRTRVRKLFQMIGKLKLNVLPIVLPTNGQFHSTVRSGVVSDNSSVDGVQNGSRNCADSVQYVFVWLHYWRRIPDNPGICTRIHGNSVRRHQYIGLFYGILSANDRRTDIGFELRRTRKQCRGHKSSAHVLNCLNRKALVISGTLSST